MADTPGSVYRGPCVVDGIPARLVFNSRGGVDVEEFKGPSVGWVPATGTSAIEVLKSPVAGPKNLASWGVPESDVDPWVLAEFKRREAAGLDGSTGSPRKVVSAT